MTSDEAKPGEVAFTLTWEADNGALHGVLEAVNITDHPVRLSGKPGVTPIGLDGELLSAETVVSLEMRLPGYVELPPGARATSTISWYAWDGPPAGDRARITWSSGETEAPVTGPSQPTNRDGATNLSSTWFD